MRLIGAHGILYLLSTLLQAPSSPDFPSCLKFFFVPSTTALSLILNLPKCSIASHSFRPCLESSRASPSSKFRADALRVLAVARPTSLEYMDRLRGRFLTCARFIYGSSRSLRQSRGVLTGRSSVAMPQGEYLLVQLPKNHQT